MTPAALAAIEKRVAAATPGPWRWSEPQDWAAERAFYGDGNGNVLICDFGTVTGVYDTAGTAPSDADAALIANAPTDLAALLAHIRTMEAEREAEIAAAALTAAAEALAAEAWRPIAEMTEVTR